MEVTVIHTDLTGTIFYDIIPSYSAGTNIICVAVASAEESWANPW